MDCLLSCHDGDSGHFPIKQHKTYHLCSGLNHSRSELFETILTERKQDQTIMSCYLPSLLSESRNSGYWYDFIGKMDGCVRIGSSQFDTMFGVNIYF